MLFFAQYNQLLMLAKMKRQKILYSIFDINRTWCISAPIGEKNYEIHYCRDQANNTPQYKLRDVLSRSDKTGLAK